MRFHRLRGDGELAGDLLVGVPTRDVAQHLALARGEQVEVGIDRVDGYLRERVEHEARQPG